MSGFRKAKAEQAALKIGVYGPSGSGKTFTSLLMAEGLARVTGKRIAFVDTEHGTDFYCKPVPARRVHPEAFDFDALYTKSLTEVLAQVKSLRTNDYGVLIIDSITHIWEAARLAYEGKQTRIGTIPMHAWGQIKKPYKELMGVLLSSPMHVIFCGRQGNEYAQDTETDEITCVGVKMKAEGETPYEPHILIRMEAVKQKKGDATITAYAEKDRTGVLAGRTFVNPTYDMLCAPLMDLLGDKQAKMQTDDEVSQQDAEALSAQERQKEERSTELLQQFSAKMDLASTLDDLKAVGKEITAELKKQMLAAHVTQLREKHLDRERVLSGKAQRTLEPVDG